MGIGGGPHHPTGSSHMRGRRVEVPAVVRAVLRGVVVLTSAAMVAIGGNALLHANSAVRPMWTGPQAVAMANTQLTRIDASLAQAQQGLDSLQADVAQLSDQVDQANQLVNELESGFGGFGLFRGAE